MTQIGKAPPVKPAEIADTLRRRILARLRSGVLARGDRLPSTRDLARQLDADPRAILAAYRLLEQDGLVEMRPRSGIYVADRPGASSTAPGLAEGWLVELFVQGIGRDIPAPDLAEWMRRSVETLRLRVAVIAATVDQRDGLCRELRADYGLEAVGIDPAVLSSIDRMPIDIRRADFLLTTNEIAARVRPMADATQKPLVAITVRPDLIAPEWRAMLERPSFVVVVDPLFGEMLRHYFASAGAAPKLRTMVVGSDDIGTIPADAPTYVTRAARERLGDAFVPGRIVPPVRTLSPESAREVLGIIVRSNLAVVGGRDLPAPWPVPTDRLVTPG